MLPGSLITNAVTSAGKKKQQAAKVSPNPKTHPMPYNRPFRNTSQQSCGLRCLLFTLGSLQDFIERALPEKQQQNFMTPEITARRGLKSVLSTAFKTITCRYGDEDEYDVRKILIAHFSSTARESRITRSVFRCTVLSQQPTEDGEPRGDGSEPLGLRIQFASCRMTFSRRRWYRRAIDFCPWFLRWQQMEATKHLKRALAVPPVIFVTARTEFSK